MKRTLFALALVCASAHADVSPGNWELALAVAMTGQQAPVNAVETRCLSEAAARDPGSVLNLGGTCEFSNRNDDGSTFTFDVACTGALPMKGKGTVRYTADTMNGDLDLTDDKGGFAMRTSVKGRRLGPC